MLDQLEQLLPAKWRDVEFPTTRFRVSIAHDLVEHKSWGVDGARIESTGLAPVRFTFSAPLTNGIVPGKNERWSVLYPDQMRALLAAFQQKKRGVLQHPEFGEVACKAERLDLDWDANRRGGCDAELSFVQTLIEGDKSFIDFPSPVQEAELAALDLDADQTKRDLKALLEAAGADLPPYLVDDTVSLTDFVRAVQKVVDTPSVLSYRAAGKINSIVYQAKRIQQSVERAKSALTWPVTQSVERVKANAYQSRQKMLEKDRTVGVYRVVADTTIAGVARQIPEANVSDLVRLNPSLMSKPVVSAGTLVRYYIPRAA